MVLQPDMNDVARPAQVIETSGRQFDLWLTDGRVV
jgi:hypothetical protein